MTCLSCWCTCMVVPALVQLSVCHCVALAFCSISGHPCTYQQMLPCTVEHTCCMLSQAGAQSPLHFATMHGHLNIPYTVTHYFQPCSERACTLSQPYTLRVRYSRILDHPYGLTLCHCRRRLATDVSHLISDHFSGSSLASQCQL